jgi:hypothetical protein
VSEHAIHMPYCEVYTTNKWDDCNCCLKRIADLERELAEKRQEIIDECIVAARRYESLEKSKDDAWRENVRLERELQEAREMLKVLGRIRAAIVDCYGGMHSGSAVWGKSPYDKGWSNGIQAALTAFDHETKDFANRDKE